ncbi:MAG: anthranilate phosphoribosyltransferase, partial [Candidatus Dormibacteraeota bacterium]|nr:anthranilate phosphoribosyltransferase [Candidatus Dormibacteraeota bacterium]
EAAPSQIAAFAVALRLKGETAAEMTGLVGAMLDIAERVPLPPAVADEVIDTCGTGGDRSGTINVSTIAAFVAAGAGAKVCKHGNRAATSQAGSAAVLEALGVPVELGPEEVARCVVEIGMGFCFAPRFHPAMRHAGPVRNELGVRTIFNVLGPLANPARVRRQALGVADPAMAPLMAGVLQRLGHERALVFSGPEGIDELGLGGPSRCYEVSPEGVREFSVDPAELGLRQAAVTELRVGDAGESAERVRSVLRGEHGAARDVVLLNASAALVAAGRCDGWAEGLQQAAASIDSGGASRCLETLVAVSNRGWA